MEPTRDHLHLRWTTEQHVLERQPWRITSLNNHGCQLYSIRSEAAANTCGRFPGRTQAFLAEAPRGT
uniref:Uncharacterized protein n=1 Tax=Oryctolagus cuniculus TaxID=9986 RepID=A0A5F9DN33_RABIT